MPYDYEEDSIEGRLLTGDPTAIGTVSRWIAFILTQPRFWALRREWQDLHQEVMGRVVESLERRRFEPRRDFRRYVQGIARNTARQARLQRVEVPLELISERIDETRMESEADARMFARRVLDGATPTCRELIRLHFLEQMSYEEIAQVLHRSVGTVKSRLFRCLACARRNQIPTIHKVDG